MGSGFFSLITTVSLSGDADLCHALEQALVLVGAGRRRCALIGEFHRLGVERFAVLELDALAQLERIGLQVGRDFPAFGEQWRNRAVFLDLGQRLVNIVERDFGDRRGGRGGRDRGRAAPASYPSPHCLSCPAPKPAAAAGESAANAAAASRTNFLNMSTLLNGTNRMAVKPGTADPIIPRPPREAAS